MVDAALRLHELSIAFGGVQAVKDVTLGVREGEILGLIGPNGAGKTTLVNLISGHERPDKGSVHLGDKDISKLAVHQRAQLGLARSFQRTNIYPSLTVWENVWHCAAASRIGHFRVWVTRAQRAMIAEAADEALDATQLTGERDTVASALSHGRSRALEVALLLAARGKVLLLDEPAAGMPLDGVRNVIRTLADIHARSKPTMLIVEHKLPVVFGLCDRIAVLDQGRLLAIDTPDAIASNPKVKEAYLGESLEV
jgi:branched-chain amino acid transport system ATP-binding protein